MLAGGVPHITNITGDNKLTVWLCTNVFTHYTIKKRERSSLCQSSVCSVQETLSKEEEDIVHYIGGFVIAKLKKSSRAEDYTHLCHMFVSESMEQHTLVAAKSRGRLTALTKDGKCIFVGLEEVFRNMYPASVVRMSCDEFITVCQENSVIQDCFHSATDVLESKFKDQLFIDIVRLYFKVRVHQKCKIYLESVRRSQKMSHKDRALRTKLAK